MLKRYFSLFLFCSIIFLCACGTLPKDDKMTETITFTDALGREVTVEKNPERVATLIGSFADIWLLAGGDVCATADDAWDDFMLPLSKDTKNLGGTKNPSLEVLLASNPDFVIASAATAKNVEWKDILENAGITVAYFDVSSFEEYLSMLNICTDITGRKDLYEKNGTALAEKIEATKSAFADAMGKNKPTVLFLRASAGYIRAKNSHGSVLGEMLADLGCLNIADNDKNLLETLSIESILTQDPQHILIVQVGDDAEAVKAGVSKMMSENPAWQELSAVKNGNLHYMDKRLFNLKPNARFAEAYEILTEILQKTK